MPDPDPYRVFLVAGEHSGDSLGGPFLTALNALSDRPIVTEGVGGASMKEAGCSSLFPLSDIAVMGPIAIIKRYPLLRRRALQTVDAALQMKPDALVILDSPEFTHPIAKRVRKRNPDIPIIDYVSPSVWAWRSGRARKMRNYIDHVLAILPFEPAVHKRLGGPACTYVGHPLIERHDWINKLDPAILRERLGIATGTPVIAVLPGSRVTEIKRMMPVYGETIRLIQEKCGAVEVVMPLAEGSEPHVHEHLADWPTQPHFLQGEEAKFTAFRLADAALATSGTVTLELAMAGTPMIVAYKTEAIVSAFRWMLQAHSIVLPNLVLGENAFPEFIQGEASPEQLASHLSPLLDHKSPERKRQEQALSQIAQKMQLPSGTPSERAARIVLDLIKTGR